MKRALLLAAIVVLIALVVWYCRPPGPTIALELESYGGFAYIHSPAENKLEIAYLKDSGPECAEPVDQLGTDLMVVSGSIVDPPAWPGKLFEVTGAVVSFPDLEAGTADLKVDRGPRPVGAPANPGDPTQWYDTKWVAGISSGSPESDYPSHSLNPNWRSLVDGRVVLTRGKIQASHPSDYVMQHTTFEFRTPPSATGVVEKRFTQSITDSTLFTSDVPGDEVVISLSGQGPDTPNTIVVKPTAPNRPVRLKLIGRHVHNMPASLPVGTPISHFCAFYALMQPVPTPAEQLIPHVAQVAAVSGDRLGQPSPGSSCPGDWP
jgi:hypothetical protein